MPGSVRAILGSVASQISATEQPAGDEEKGEWEVRIKESGGRKQKPEARSKEPGETGGRTTIRRSNHASRKSPNRLIADIPSPAVVPPASSPLGEASIQFDTLRAPTAALQDEKRPVNGLNCSGEFISPSGGRKPPLREMRALLEHLTQLAHFAIRALER